MPIIIDPALQFLSPRINDEFEREIARGRSSMLSDAILPLNRELLNRRDRIQALQQTVDRQQERIRRLTEPGYTLDALDEHDLCDAWAGLPAEFFNSGKSFR